MNLYGWDIVFATKLDVINQIFKDDLEAFASRFSFETEDPFFGSKINIAGNFESWHIAANDSNKLIHLNLEVGNICLTGLVGANLEGSNVNVILELNLSFITDSLNAYKQNLVFDYSGPVSTDNNNITLISATIADNSLSQIQLNQIGNAVKICLLMNPDKLNYAFAETLIKNSEADWLSPDKVAFSLSKTGAGDTYFSLFGSIGSNLGQEGQVDSQLFNSTDNMFMGVSGGLFLDRILSPSLRAKLNPSSSSFANNVLTFGKIALPKVSVKCEGDFFPYLSSIRFSIVGNKLVIDALGACDINRAGIMNFTIKSINPISFNPSARSISVSTDINPTLNHDLHLDKKLQAIMMLDPTLNIELQGIAGSIAQTLTISNHIDVTLTTISMSWTNIDFQEINNGGVVDNFFLQGIMKKH